MKKTILTIAVFLSIAAINAQNKATQAVKATPATQVQEKVSPALNAAPVGTQVTPAQDKPTLTNVANENPNQASFKFSEEEFTFGTIKQGDAVNHDFEFTNSGKEPLVISNASGSCGCTVPVWPKEPIAPGAKGVIKVTFNSAGKQGMQDKTVTLQSNAKQSSMVLHLKGNVEKLTDPPAAVEPEKK